MLIPFIAYSPLVRHAIAAENARAPAEMPRNRLAARVGGTLSGQIESLRSGAGRHDAGGSRGIGKNRPPRRNLARDVNNQPAAGGYVYGLCDSHGINIIQNQ